MRLRVRLIKEWRECHKMLSVQISGIGGAVAFAYVSMYDKLKDNFSPKYMVALTVIVFIAVIAGRLVSQQPEEDDHV